MAPTKIQIEAKAPARLRAVTEAARRPAARTADHTARNESGAGAPGRARLMRMMQDTVGNRQARVMLARRVGIQATVQRSPLSDQLEQTWTGAKTKGRIFDQLRAIPPGTRAGDSDAKAWLVKTFGQGTDDLWLAQTILQYGPEPLWPDAALTERQRRASQNKWAPEPGGIEATLGLTKEKREVKAFFFPGTTNERALVIAGVHGTERQGIQVAELLMERLKKTQPYFTVIVVPTLFPDNAAVKTKKNPFGLREGDTETNRNFPTGGKTLAEAKAAGGGKLLDKNKKAILPENIMLLELMERFQPSRIISIHGTWDASKAGVFSDPHFLSDSKRQELWRTAWALAGEQEMFRPPARTPGEQERRRFADAVVIEQQLVAEAEKLNKQRTLDDKQLAIAAAHAIAGKTKGLIRAGPKEVKENPAVAGNRLDRGPGKENPGWLGDVKKGVSLGSYAPGRGMSVFTVEPAINRNIGDYPSTDLDPKVSKAEREMELKTYAEVIETVLLGDPAKAKKGP